MLITWLDSVVIFFCIQMMLSATDISLHQKFVTIAGVDIQLYVTRHRMSLHFSVRVIGIEECGVIVSLILKNIVLTSKLILT